MERTAHRSDFVIRAALDETWAILPSKLAAIRSLLQLRAQGFTLSEDEIRARIGVPKAQPKATASGGAVAVLPVFGVISHRMNMMTEFSGGTSTEMLTAQLRALVADSSVDAIVMDFDSPGGGVFGVPELAEEMRNARQKKQIIAVANASMASAAYWIGSAASEIVVTPSGQAGSIGVFVIHEDHSQELAQEGVAVTLIKAGEYKAEDNPFGPLSDEAKAAIQGRIDAYYSMFLREVAKGRGVSVETVRDSFGGGRMMNAKDAVRVGMADRIATMDEVIAGLMKGGGSATVGVAALDEAVFGASDGLIGMDLAVGSDETVMVEAFAAATVAADGLTEANRRRLNLRLLEMG